MIGRPWILVVAVAAILFAPQAVQAQSEEDPCAWHGDLMLGPVIPLGPGAYADATGLGGRLAPRVYRGPFEALLDLTVMTHDQTELDEVLSYRVRGLAGYRHIREFATGRAVIFRALGGVELGGFDAVASSDWGAEAHRFGAAVEVGAESRSHVDWGGVVALSMALGISVQPFGDDDAGEARYVGIDLIANASIGF